MTESRFVIAEYEAELAVAAALEELARARGQRPDAAPLSPGAEAILRENLTRGGPEPSPPVE